MKKCSLKRVVAELAPLRRGLNIPLAAAIGLQGAHYNDIAVHKQPATGYHVAAQIITRFCASFPGSNGQVKRPSLIIKTR
jgi:hypothetical protein